MDLKAFINSVWFRGLSRGSMIVLTLILIPGFIWVWAVVAGNTDKHVKIIDGQVQQISDAQASRAKDNDDFQNQTATDLGSIRTDIANLKVDVRVVRGILQQMSDRNSAAAAAQLPPQPQMPPLRVMAVN